MTTVIVATGIAVGVAAALLYPALMPALRLRRREWRAHRGRVLHWYANFDEDLQYEPRYERDIVPLTLREIVRRGYKPTGLVMIVPRTFRGKVAGDRELTLWRSDGADTPSMWLCTPPRVVRSVAYSIGGDSAAESAGRVSPANARLAPRRVEPETARAAEPAIELHWKEEVARVPDSVTGGELPAARGPEAAPVGMIAGSPDAALLAEQARLRRRRAARGRSLLPRQPSGARAIVRRGRDRR